MAQIYIDAAARQQPLLAAGGIVIKENNETHKFSVPLGEIDNHSAEWLTFISSLKKAKKLNINSVLIYTDSKVIVDSFDKGFIKNTLFKSFYDEALDLSKNFDLFIVTFLPRSKNKEADNIAKNALYKMMNTKH